MDIKLLDKNGIFLKGKKESVLVNPNEKEVEIRKESRIVLYTNEEFNGIGLRGDRVLIEGAGEYEVGGIEILGINGENGNTVYRLVVDGITVVVLGNLKQELSSKRVEKIDSTDVLLAPTLIDGKCSFKLVKEAAKKWGVNYLIPMFDEEKDLRDFLDAADEEGLEPVDVLKVEKVDLPEGMELKLLKKA